jgi:tetratricopeptide (TPR) repeat protein
MSYLNQSGYDSAKAQRYDDAEVYWQENLALAEHIFGKNSSGYITQLLSKSSNTLLYLKKPELAKSLALQALEITNTLKNDSLIVSCLRNIARAQSKLKEYNEAEINLRKILDMETQYKAKEDSETDLSISYDSLATYT